MTTQQTSPDTYAGVDTPFIPTSKAVVDLLGGDTSKPASAPDRAAFEQLADEWEQATRLVSNISPYLEHSAYRQIIAMGTAAVPWLLDRLDKGSASHWFVALYELTGANPVPPESRGRFREMTNAWLEWGRQQGYTWESDAYMD